MLISINGFLGYGKTLLASYFAYLVRGKQDIYSNYNLKIKGAKVIEIEDLENITHGLIIIDEAYDWLDSRESGSSRNKYLSKIGFQSRKKHLNIITTQQLHGSLELRFRMLENLTITAGGLNANESAFTYLFEGWGKVKPINLSMNKAELVFPLYDTFEYPESAPSIWEPKKYNKAVDNIIDFFREKFGDNLFKVQVTQNMVKDLLMQEGMYNRTLAEGVHARLQRLKMESKLNVG